MEKQKLVFAEDLFDLIEAEEKQVTIRKDRRDIQLGILECEAVDSKRKLDIDVIMILYCKLFDTPEDLFERDGFTDRDDLVEGMKRYYPDITSESECTIIIFEKLIYD